MVLAKFFLLALCSINSALAPLPNSMELKGKETEIEAHGSLYSILTLNACMMDGEIPTRFGGMTPAEERVERVANFILEEDPDIFLGQEIMSTSGSVLHEKLKERYTYFWTGIGKVPGKEESGLFVASKKPFQGTPQFIPFPDEYQIDKKFFPNQTRFLERGFFALDMGEFWIVTSHLEGGREPQYGASEHRFHQLDLITEQMDKIANGKPYLLAGDLNLFRNGNEDDDYSRSNLTRDYYDFYTLTHPNFDETTATCTNYFTALANGQPIPTEADAKQEIDDYVLIRKPYQDHFANLEVTLIDKTFDLNQPREQAISDHKAYKATFEFKDIR